MSLQLRHYIDRVFERYDWDKSGTLNPEELANFMTVYYESVGDPTKVTPEVARWYMEAIDLDRDGKINKQELFEAFKFLAPQELSAVVE